MLKPVFWCLQVKVLLLQLNYSGSIAILNAPNAMLSRPCMQSRDLTTLTLYILLINKRGYA